MTKYFFTSVNHLILPDSNKVDIEILPGLRLTNDKDIINSIATANFYRIDLVKVEMCSSVFNMMLRKVTLIFLVRN